MIHTQAVTHTTRAELVRLEADARALRLPVTGSARARPRGFQRSRLRGRGMTFAEVREYQPGDDIRTIDWRVTARRQSPHAKIYEEERERPVLLIADLGDTLFFASTGAYKQVRCAQATALLAWLALGSGDQVGGLVFNNTELETLKPARRKKAVIRLLDALDRLQHQPSAPPVQPVPDARLDRALQEARHAARTGSRVFIVSDFMAITDQTVPLLAGLSRHNSVTALRIQDPLEASLPERGQFSVASPSGPITFDAGNPAFRRAWQEKTGAHELRLEETFRRAGMPWLTLSTAQPPTEALLGLIGAGGRLL